MMRAFLRRHRERTSSAEDGLTLVEMLVSMLIMGIILAAVASIFLATTRAVEANQHRVQQADTARVGIESMSRALRAAVLPSQDVTSGSCTGVGGGGICLSAFIKGTPSSMQFYSNIDNPTSTQKSGTNNLGPRKVTYALDANNNLVQTIQVPDLHQWNDYNWQYSGCSTVPQNCRTSVISTHVTQLGGTAIFTYYQNGAALSGSSFDADALKQVDSIDVVLSVEESGGAAGSAPTTYIQRVALPNVDTYISQAGS